MPAILSPNAKQQFFDNAGNPAAGFMLYTYAAGTTTPQATFSNRAGVSANANPIILDARGEATIYLTPGIVYDYVLKTALDAEVWTRAGVTADAGDAASIGFLQSGTGAVARTVQEKARERVTPFDYGALGDGVTDDTLAIQKAIDTGKVVDMLDRPYRVDTQVVIPVGGCHVIGNGWSIARGVGVVNNGQALFVGAALTGAVRISGGKLAGNVVRLGPGYLSEAAAIRIDGGPAVHISGLEASGWASGLQLYDVDRVRVTADCKLHGNILTGISGRANDVVVEGSTIKGNGFAGSSGQTHEIYFINSSHGVIRNCDIGDSLDATASALSLRYDESSSTAGFDTIDGWDVYGNRLSVNGVSVGSDPGVVVANRKPPKNVNVFKNTFVGGADLRFDDPENCKSWSNIGIDKLVVGVVSAFPGYAMGFVSDGDDCVQVQQNALVAIRLVAMDAIIFKNTTIRNGANPAFNEIAGFGGRTACTIIEPRILGTGNPFDTASLERFQTHLEIPVKATGSMRGMARQTLGATETAVATGGTFTPNNYSVSEQMLVARINGNTATIAAPTVAADGMILRLLIRQAYASGATTLTFNAAYKLTAATAAALGTNASNQYLALTFVYVNAAWRQMGDASWTAA